jgi:hypothetical protein
MKKMLLLFVMLVALSSGTLVASCGGGGDEEDVSPTPQASEEASPTEGQALEEETVQVNETFWHAGWKVTLEEATLTPGNFGSAELSIIASFENLGSDEATFDSQLLLTSSGNDYSGESFAAPDLPRVPGERKGEGAFVFQVDDEFTIDDATLIVGNPDNNQAIVPIGPDGDDLISLEPRQIPAAGSVTAGALTLTVERAELRADFPDKHTEMEEGSLALSIFFSATPAAGIQVGQGVLQSQHVIIELPNGTAVAVVSDGVSGVNELLQGKEGTTIPDLRARFEVPSDAFGTYAFVLRGAYGPGGADVEGKLEFDIGAASPTP